MVDKEFISREKLLNEAFQKSQSENVMQSPINFSTLIQLMKKQSKTHGFLSSIYFAGSNGDHPYFLQTDNLAIGLSVLPEDAIKSRKRKRHPNQTEIIFVIEGMLILEIFTGSQKEQNILKSGDYFIIHPNTCHSIIPLDNNDGVFIFIKTNPNIQPKSVNCNFKI